MRFKGLTDEALKIEIERMNKTIDLCSSESMYIEWLKNEQILRSAECCVSELFGKRGAKSILVAWGRPGLSDTFQP